MPLIYALRLFSQWHLAVALPSPRQNPIQAPLIEDPTAPRSLVVWCSTIIPIIGVEFIFQTHGIAAIIPLVAFAQIL